MNDQTSSINDPGEENLDRNVLRNEIHVFLSKTGGGEFSTGTLGKFHPALTGRALARKSVGTSLAVAGVSALVPG